MNGDPSIGNMLLDFSKTQEIHLLMKSITKQQASGVHQNVKRHAPSGAPLRMKTRLQKNMSHPEFLKLLPAPPTEQATEKVVMEERALQKRLLQQRVSLPEHAF